MCRLAGGGPGLRAVGGRAQGHLGLWSLREAEPGDRGERFRLLEDTLRTINTKHEPCQTRKVPEFWGFWLKTAPLAWHWL